MDEEKPNYRKKFKIKGLDPNESFAKSLKPIARHHWKRITKRIHSYLETKGEEELHDLRIAFRRFRYLLEPYCIAIKPSEFQYIYKILVDMQNILGDRRDLDVMEKKIREQYQNLNESIPPELESQWEEEKIILNQKIDENLNSFLKDKSFQKYLGIKNSD